MSIHQPVMLKEVLDFLQIKPGGKYVDATFGGGGHTQEILNTGGIVLGLDVSPTAVKAADSHPHLTIVRANFNKLLEIAPTYGFSEIDGILFDFGVSSDELAQVNGLSFNRDEPLDMRLDPELGVTAADLLNALPERRLDELFATYGEESFSRSLARSISRARAHKKIETTSELVQIVERVKGRQGSARIHPATRIFQALRIAVNDELESIKEVLPQAQELLKHDGRLVTISFHSGEDRIVKEFIKNSSLVSLTKKPVEPTFSEVATNPRSRSAKLRAAEKT